MYSINSIEMSGGENRLKKSKCIVPGCTLESQTHHRIPSRKWVAESWKRAINSPLLEHVKAEDLGKYFVCSNHFQASDYSMNSTRKLLMINARPNQNLPANVTIETRDAVQEAVTGSGIDEPLGYEDVRGEIDHGSLNADKLLPVPEISVQFISEPSANDNSAISKEISSADSSQNQQVTSMSQMEQRDVIQVAMAGLGIDEIIHDEILVSEHREGRNTHKSQNGNKLWTELQVSKKVLSEKSAPQNSFAPSQEIRIAPDNQGYIEKLRKEVIDLKRRNKTLSQKLRRHSKKLDQVKGIMKSDLVVKWDSLTEFQQNFLGSQLRNAGRKPKGRRFTGKDKVRGLAMSKRSGSCYRFLSSQFILPGRSTTNKVLRAIPSSTGLTEIVLAKLRELGKQLDEKEKYCSLIWDEVSLMHHLQYDKSADRIVGFEDWGFRRRAKFADHGLVFLLRGINSGWTLPVFHGFCAALTTEPDLIRCIKTVVGAVQEAGFHVVVTICDQSSTNRSAIKKLIEESNKKRMENGEEPEDNTIIINGYRIIVLFDPPHLVKGSRNNLVTKYLEMDLVSKVNDRQQQAKRLKIAHPVDPVASERKFARWSVIEKAYKIDQRSHGFNPRMPKLSDSSVYGDKLKKMRVKDAAEVLSQTVANCIAFFAETEYVGLCSDLKPIGKDEGRDTARALKFFNDVFDSVNGSLPLIPGTPSLRTPVNHQSPQHEFWKTAICELKNMRFVDPISLSKPKQPSYPISGWIKTLEGFQKLWGVLTAKGFTEFEPKFVNQDALENYFGIMRAHGGRNVSPSCWQFGSNYRSILICNLTDEKRVGANCENTEHAGLLFTLENLVITENEVNEFSGPTRPVDEEYDNVFQHSEPENRIISSDILMRSTDKIKVEIGKNKVVKDFWNKCGGCQISFLRPQHSDVIGSEFDVIYKRIIQTLHLILPVVCHRRQLGSVLLERVQKVIDASWIYCSSHKNTVHQEILKLIINHFLIDWCTMMNRHLTGKINHLRALPMFKEATHAYEKTRTRPKKGVKK